MNAGQLSQVSHVQNTGHHAVADPGWGGGWTGVTPPPPGTCPGPKNLCKLSVCDRGRSPPPCDVQGGWVGVCECPRGAACQFFLRMADDVTRAMSKGGGVQAEGGSRLTSHGQCPRGGAYECPS